MNDRPRPCFVCCTEPAMEGHNVCDKHHCEPRCHVCHPETVVISGEAEHAVPMGLNPHVNRERAA